MEKILITGGCGLLGSHLIEEVLDNTDWQIVCLCRTSGGSFTNNRILYFQHDLKNDISKELSTKIGPINYIAHVAANTRVDKSMYSPKEFFEDNVIGTVNLLEWYRTCCPEAKLINMLTSEVFGPAPDGYDAQENDTWRPSNPYSASKAGQGAAGISYYNSYKLPIIHTYTMNLFGERQQLEKFVAKSIINILDKKTIKIHAKLKNNGDVEYVGSRKWLYARNAANAIIFLFRYGAVGEHYNIVGDTEFNNDDLIKKIASLMNKTPNIEYSSFDTTRPGHDKRFSLDGSKLRNMGWKPPIELDTALSNTIQWTTNEHKKAI